MKNTDITDKDLIPGKWYALMSGDGEYFLKFKEINRYVSCYHYLNPKKKYRLGGDFSKNTYTFREVHPREINKYLPADKQEPVALPIFN